MGKSKIATKWPRLHPFWSVAVVAVALRLGRSRLLRCTGHRALLRVRRGYCQRRFPTPIAPPSFSALQRLLRFPSGSCPLLPSHSSASPRLRRCTWHSQFASPQGAFSHRKLRLLRKLRRLRLLHTKDTVAPMGVLSRVCTYIYFVCVLWIINRRGANTHDGNVYYALLSII